MEQTQVSERRGNHSEQQSDEGAAGRGPRLPVRAAPEQADDAETGAALSALRRFCLGEPGAAAALDAPDETWLPAALYPYRNQQSLRQDYPLFVSVGPDGAPACRPIVDLLFEAVEAFAPEPDEAKALKDNLSRLELELRAKLADLGSEPADAGPAIRAACEALDARLALKGDSAKQLQADLARLTDSVPDGGVFLPMSEQTALRLYAMAARAEAAARANALHAEITRLRSRLRDLLATERAKGDAGRDESKLTGSIGASEAGHFDAAALSKVLGRIKQGRPGDPDRIQRLGDTIAVFETYLADPGEAQPHILSRRAAPAGLEVGLRWLRVDADPCTEASAIFDRLAGDRVELIAAIRTARLELSRGYDPARHDPLVRSLDWRAFSQDELLLLPPVLALETPEQLGGPDMVSLSRLLLSGRPVDVLVDVPAAGDPGAGAGEALTRYRLELAYLGMGHREALVNQTTAARPGHMLEGFLRGLRAMHASLHVVASGLTAEGAEPRLGAWLHGGAALEGRAHPLFHYDPEAGDTWAARLDFSMNPSAEEDWPACAIPHTDAGGVERTIATRFTFADFALLEESFRAEFRVVPDGLAGDTLLDAPEYFTLDPDASAEMIPFVWAADGRGRLRRLAFTRRLAFACRDRLDYWHTLQELSGVRNEFVREAVANERARLNAEFAAERETLNAEHAAEIERVQKQAAGEALRRLAEGLVNADLSTLAGSATATARAPAPPPAPPQAKADVTETAPEPAPEEADAGVDEPYIDSALCTSCNDCTNLNGRLFKYNANKQAFIADPASGTFAELVVAAEKCPARCIHPGKPQNPNEPGLAELIERAKPFN